MKKLIIADIRSNAVDGKLRGHYIALSNNFREVFGKDYNVMVSGGPVYKNYFKGDGLLPLPFDVSGEGAVDKLKTLVNAIVLFWKAWGGIVVLQQSTVVTSFVSITLFYWLTSRLYLIQYNTEALNNRFKRFLYRMAKWKIDGVLCPNKYVGDAYGLPYCIVPDYIYASSELPQMKPFSERRYDFCVLGSLTADKGIIEVARYLAGTDYSMLIAGHAAEETVGCELKVIAAEAPNIELRIGFIEDVDYRRLMRESRYCILNYRGTYFDRSSGVVLDALYQGTPVVGTRCRALEIVSELDMGMLYDDLHGWLPSSLLSPEVHQAYLSHIAQFLLSQSCLIKRVEAFLEGQELSSHSRLLIFHPAIAPYRIDFFNSLTEAFPSRVCLMQQNVASQAFDQRKLLQQCHFQPVYLNGRIRLVDYWRQLCSYRPEVVITHEFGLSTLTALIWRYLTRQRCSVVSICDDSYDMVAKGNDFSRFHRLSRKSIAPLVNNLILVEPRVVEWYQQYYGKGIWFPIIKSERKAEEMYRNLQPESRKISERYGLVGKRVFLFVGRLVKLKNVECVIKSFARLNQVENVLVVIGDGPEKPHLQAKANELAAHVVFTGRLEGNGLNAWYNVADCFVLASYQEAFGAVTNEALVAGCWCLVSNRAGSSCLIENGVNGYTFDPCDEEELSKWMRQSIETLEKQEQKHVTRKNRMLVKYDKQMNIVIEQLKTFENVHK